MLWIVGIGFIYVTGFKPKAGFNSMLTVPLLVYANTDTFYHTRLGEASDHALQLQYNANSELVKSMRTQYQGNQVIKTLAEYHYDAFGRRIHKHSKTRNFTQNKDQLRQTNKTQHKHTHMLWDSDLPIQEYSGRHVYTTIYD